MLPRGRAVERRERAGQVALGRGHDRPRAGQRRIDPDPRKRASPVLEPREYVPRTVDFTELHQQLDVERLGAIEEAVLDADLIEQLRICVSARSAAGWSPAAILDEAKHAQQDRRPPRLLRCSGLLDEWPQRRSGAIEPAPMSIDQRPPGKRVGEPAAHFQPLLDRVAAALDQLLGEVAPASLELDQAPGRRAAQPHGAHRHGRGPSRILGHTVLEWLRHRRCTETRSAEPGAGSAWPSSRLELEPSLHQFGARRPSQEQVEQAQVDQQRREHSRLLVGAHVLHGPLSMFECAGRLAGTPIRTSRAEIRALSRGSPAAKLERLFEMRGREPDRTVIPPDLGEQLQALCLQRSRQVTCRRTLGEQPRTGDVAGLEQRGRMTERPPTSTSSLSAGVSRHAAANSSAAASNAPRTAACPRSLLDPGRRRLIGLRRALREVASALLLIGDNRSQSAMELPAPRARRSPVHRGRQQGVGEPDATLLDDENARLLRLEDRRQRLALVLERGRDRLDRRPRQRRRHEHGLPRGERQRATRSAASVCTLRGTGSGSGPPDSSPAPASGPGDLEREQRVAAGGLRDAREHRARERAGEPPADDVMQRRERERTKDYAPEPVLRHGAVEVERSLIIALGPPRQRAAPAGREAGVPRTRAHAPTQHPPTARRRSPRAADPRGRAR